MRAILLVLSLGCGCANPPPPAPITPPPAPPAPTAPAPTIPTAPAPEAPVEIAPNAGQPQQIPAGAPARVAARHILVAWAGARKAKPQTRRTRAQAYERTQQIHARLDQGEDFATLARELSDGASAPRGGDLGVFARGVMAPAFENSAFSLKVGQISDIVETPFGFHIIERLPLSEVHVAHIVVQWTDLPGSTTTRSQQQALAIAQAAHQRIAQGEPLGQVAAELSDGPSGKRGGDLGWFQRGQMVPAFDDVAFALEPGQVSDVIETPKGYHIIQRIE